MDYDYAYADRLELRLIRSLMSSWNERILTTMLRVEECRLRAVIRMSVCSTKFDVKDDT